MNKEKQFIKYCFKNGLKNKTETTAIVKYRVKGLVGNDILHSKNVNYMEYLIIYKNLNYDYDIIKDKQKVKEYLKDFKFEDADLKEIPQLNDNINYKF